MEKANRKYKDSVFVDLFSSCDEAEGNFRSLYSALSGSKLSSDVPLQNIRLENTVYRGLENDVSYLVGEKMVVLVEHQSTINENMPRRCLGYLSKTYDSLLDVRGRYQRKLQMLPRPEFYVLYNGIDDYVAEDTLRLSDAFFDGFSESGYNNGEVMAEIVVKVININSVEESKLLRECRVLGEYSIFVDRVRRYSREDNLEGFDRAIEECINNGVLSEYLQKRAAEVRNMLIAEYDYEMDIMTQREEAEKIGEARGEARGRRDAILDIARQMLLKKYSVESVTEITGLTAEEIEGLQF